jgi:N-ethylmaleimide reductase
LLPLPKDPRSADVPDINGEQHMLDNTRSDLFSSYTLSSGLELKNRVVMAPMTRGRARNAGLVPTDLHVEYYRQRATAGLIITEATWVNREGIGFINVPGIFSPEQVDGWKAVTEAIHAEGGRIYLQIAHSGAVSHPDFFDGQPPLAPSAVNPGLKAFTNEGFKDTVTPREMTIAQIEKTISDYAKAAKNAKAAGFDGLELHSATTYLLPQFLNSRLNVRTDAYGGSPENRARIVIEILEAMIAEWGPGRIGVKLSPTLAMGGFGPTDQTVATYEHLAKRLSAPPPSPRNRRISSRSATRSSAIRTSSAACGTISLSACRTAICITRVAPMATPTTRRRHEHSPLISHESALSMTTATP